MFVYFIQAGGKDGPVKIGIAADPEGRREILQTGNHEELDVVAAIPGDQDLERDYHIRFAAGRIRGEWFAIETPGLRKAMYEAVRVETAHWIAEEEMFPTEFEDLPAKPGIYGGGGNRTRASFPPKLGPSGLTNRPG